MEDKIPKIKAGVRARKETFGGLIFTNRTPILSLNQDSFLIWEAIDGVHSPTDICSCLQAANPERDIDIRVIEEFVNVCEDLDLLTY